MDLSLLNNQWITGVGTSLISGLLVFFLTKRFFTDRQNKEYNQRIKTANNEILYAIRPLIVEKTKPNLQILNSVLHSTVKKYNVELADIYNTYSLCDDLTNEIMSNSFLSSEQKIELSGLINDLKNDESTNKDSIKTETLLTVKNNKNSINSMSLILSLTVAMMTLLFVLLEFQGLKTSIGRNDFEFVFIILVATLVPMMALVLTRMLKIIKEKQTGETVRYVKKDTSDA